MTTTGTSNELRSLLRLLDDESPTVREAVKERLSNWGADLADAILEVEPDADPELIASAIDLQKDHEKDDFVEHWAAWMEMPSDLDKLERGLALIASWLSPWDGPEPDITMELDRLAEEFQAAYPVPDFRNLSTFLFQEEGFAGDTERYYHPENSNLASVLERRTGNPISLACVYILTGIRCGLDVGGCNYPAHFLARAWSDREGELYLVDCFNEGKIIPAPELIKHHPLASQEVGDVVEAPAPAEVIILRVLRNLENAFAQTHQQDQIAFVRRLWRQMSDHREA